MTLREKITAKIKSIIPKGMDISLSVPENDTQGHYSTNIAFRIAKQKGVAPMEEAKRIATKLLEAAPPKTVAKRPFWQAELFERVEAVSPGFINIWIKPKAIQGAFQDILKDEKNFGRSKIGKGKKVIIEYSQPNIAKRMHAGHIRSTIIGDALANIYEFAGYKVIRWNYIGDWGTQFGKLIAAYKLWGSKKEVEKDPIETLLHLYVRFHNEMAKNPSLEARGQEEFKKLEAGDKENRKLWKWFRDESLIEYKRIYKFLDIRFDVWTGESAYEKDLQGIVLELKTKGIAKNSEGAVIVPLDEEKLPPALIQKSDGASIYLTRDIASLRHRIRKYKPAKILYVVSNEQSLHFEQLFAVAKKLSWNNAELAHVKFGLMLGENHKKLSTRGGLVVALDELIESMVRETRKAIDDKYSKLSSKEKDLTASVIGVGALKYNDLRENRNSDIVFNWKHMLDFTGDSAPYLQYACVRLLRIVGKSRGKNQPDFSKLTADNDLALMRKALEFPHVVLTSAETLYTNNLALYLYELATTANRFYETTPILKDNNSARRAARLGLIQIVASILRNGLTLLGVKTPKKM